MSKRILAWICFILGFLIIAFFKRYNGEVIPYPSLFYYAGFLLFIVGFFLLRKSKTGKESKMIEKAKQFVDDLKQNGNRIQVDLPSCIIKENNYFEEPDNYRSATDLELFTADDWVYIYNKYYSPVSLQKNQTVLVYKANSRGVEQVFNSIVIPLDKVSLSFKIDQQKKTFLYIDKNDVKKYYFDLDFIFLNKIE